MVRIAAALWLAMEVRHADLAWFRSRSGCDDLYEYDSSTGRAGNGLSASAAGGKAPMVNWDVVSEDWHNLQSNVRSTTDSIERKLKQHSG